MSAGLPGLGLGGLFFVLSALLAPLVELGRTIQGRSSAASWVQVGRQFAIAATMVVAVELALRALLLAGSLLGAGTDPTGHGFTAVPLTPIGLTAGLLAAVVASAKLAQLALRLAAHRRARAGRPRKALCPEPCTCCLPEARG